MGEENKGANKLQEEKVLQAKSGFGIDVYKRQLLGESVI